GIEYQLE
ncbi:hypothetical protein MK372_10880, partial [Streptococcus oralis]|nr:hypothetical protein [Streptococcus oralis]